MKSVTRSHRTLSTVVFAAMLFGPARQILQGWQNDIVDTAAVAGSFQTLATLTDSAGAGLLVAGLALLSGGLVVHHFRRRRAEDAIRDKETALRFSHERIQHLTARLITAQEQASTRIARDLHDDVCQELAGISLEIAELRRRGGALDDAHNQFLLSSVQRRAHALVDGMRRLSHDLHPSTLRHVGLAAALEAHCIEVEQRYDTQVSLTVHGSLSDLHEEVALCLFRISQEALRNAATHGNPRRIAVSITGSGSGIELVIADDGRGFDVAATRASRGLGLVSMEERARTLDGHLHIEARPGHGTVIRVRVPARHAPSEQPDLSAVPA